MDRYETPVPTVIAIKFGERLPAGHQVVLTSNDVDLSLTFYIKLPRERLNYWQLSLPPTKGTLEHG